MAHFLDSLVIAAVPTAEVALANYPVCDPLHRPDYGDYSPYMANYSIGSRITFHCDKGYKHMELHGQSANWTKHHTGSIPLPSTHVS